MENSLFTGEGLTTKPDKYEIVKELEKSLCPDNYIFQKISPLKTAAFMDFVSQVRKLPNERIKLKRTKMPDIYSCALSSILSSVKADIVDIIYDSYLENSIKECERIRRRSKGQPLEFFGMNEGSPIPTQLDHFWDGSKNKENLQITSKDYFKKSSRNKPFHIFLSGYLTDSDGLFSCEKCVDGISEYELGLNSSIEEADGRIIPHVAYALKRGFQRAVIYSNDS